MEDILDLTAEQAKCLVSPLRDQVMSTVLANWPCSAPELARELDVHEKTIYYHVRKLERAGLIRPSGRREGTTKPEILYEPAGRRLRWRPDKTSPEEVDLAERQLRNILKRGEREAAAARAADRLVMAQAAHLRLSAADAETFRQKMKELTAWADQQRDPEGEPISYGAFYIELNPSP